MNELLQPIVTEASKVARNNKTSNSEQDIPYCRRTRELLEHP
jgi:hypothetical protein